VKDVIKILNVLKAEVEPTEELLKVHTLTLENVELIPLDVKGWCRYWKTPKFDFARCFESSKGGGEEMERGHRAAEVEEETR
jgi:hypothetical protein